MIFRFHGVRSTDKGSNIKSVPFRIGLVCSDTASIRHELDYDICIYFPPDNVQSEQLLAPGVVFNYCRRTSKRVWWWQTLWIKLSGIVRKYGVKWGLLKPKPGSLKRLFIDHGVIIGGVVIHSNDPPKPKT